MHDIVSEIRRLKSIVVFLRNNKGHTLSPNHNTSVCTHTNTNTNRHAQRNTGCTHVHTCARICTRIHPRKHTHTHSHAHTNTHISTDARTHTPPGERLPVIRQAHDVTAGRKATGPARPSSCRGAPGRPSKGGRGGGSGGADAGEAVCESGCLKRGQVPLGILWQRANGQPKLLAPAQQLPQSSKRCMARDPNSFLCLGPVSGFRGSFFPLVVQLHPGPGRGGGNSSIQVYPQEKRYE